MLDRFSRFAATMLVACLFIHSAHGHYPGRKVDDKPLFARLIGSHTLLFAHYQVKQLSAMPAIQQVIQSFPGGQAEIDKQIEKLTSMKLNEIDSFTVYLDQPKVTGDTVEEPMPPYFLVQTTSPVHRATLVSNLARDHKTLNFGKHEVLIDKNIGVSVLDDNMLFFVLLGGKRPKEEAQQSLIPYFAMLETGNEIPESLKKSVELAVARKHHMVAGVAISKELNQAAEKIFEKAPATVAPFKALTKTRQGYMTMDYLPQAENDFRMQMRVGFDDGAAAKAGQGALKFGIAMAKIGISSAMPKNADATMKQVAELASKQLDAIKSEVMENDVVVTYETKASLYMPMMLAAIAKVRRAADTMLSANNMRQMMIAMHTYHNDYNAMPPAATVKNGKPLHSWRVVILPYLEQDALFKQLNLNEPWNSEHNLKVFESVPMPKIYMHPGHKDETSKKTYYKVFTSKPGVKPSAGFSLGGRLTLGQLTVQDGTSNTVAMVESGPPVLWYQPEDIDYDPNGAFPKLESPWPDNRIQTAFFDASIHPLWLGQHEDIWKAIITRNGGEDVDVGKLSEKKK
jgi:hypothetical protein